MRQYENTGLPLPDKILNRPVLREGLQVYLEAFFNLDTERNHSNGLQTIPFSAMLKYGREYMGLDDDDLEDFLYLMRAVEGAHMNYLSAKMKAERNKK